MARLVGVCGILLVAVVATITGSGYAEEGIRYGGVLTYALSQTIPTLDPGVGVGTQGQTVRKCIWETLVERNQDGEIIPWLATGWEVSEDGTRWTFHLRPGIKFHDGTELSAEDVKASLERITNPEYALPRRSTLKMIKTVDIVDHYTVAVITEFPYAPLLSHLAMDVASIMSKAALDEFGYETEKIGWHPVGTGPYMYQSHEPERSITLVRFEDYWRGRPYLDKIVFRSIPEAATRVALLETGAVDVIENLPPYEVKRLSANPEIITLNVPGNRVAHIGLNCQKPPFDNPLVRRALCYAIDREGLVEGILGGFGTPADSIVAPGVTGYHSVPIYSYDPNRAVQLLEEAGYPNGLSFTLWTPSGRYFMDKETVEAIQAQLEEVGFHAEVRVIDWTTYLSLLRKPIDESETQAYFLGWEVGTGDIAYILDMVFTSEAWPPGWNTMFYKNEVVDQLIVQAKMTIDPAERQRINAEIQELIMNDAPWVTLFVYNQLFGLRSSIHGFWAWPSGAVILREVWKSK